MMKWKYLCRWNICVLKVHCMEKMQIEIIKKLFLHLACSLVTITFDYVSLSFVVSCITRKLAAAV